MSSTHGQTRAIPTRKTRLRSLITGGALTGLLAWWDAERDLYTDTGLTTRATNGNAVAGWRDQGSSAYHVTQSTAADCPIYRASVAAFGGKPGVEFVSSDWLGRSGLSGAVVGNLTTYSIYVVFATTSAGLETLYSEGKSDNTVPFVSLNHSADAITADNRDDGSVRATPTGFGASANNGACKILTLRRSAATAWSVRSNGTEYGTDNDNVGTTTINRLTIGAFGRATQAQFYVGHIAQVLLYSTDNYATIEPLLRSYYRA